MMRSARILVCAFILHFPVSLLLAFANKPVIPITVLSGFLGSGKTTLLQNLLENNQGLRIAVVVNDVAAVNIDSKLISSSSPSQPSSSSTTASTSSTPARPAGIVELQNGCACCSKSEELLASVSELVTLSDLRGDDDNLGFQHIVVEMSGVADPKSVRAKFQEAVLYDMPLMERVRLDTMVTLVDCTNFLQYLQSPNVAHPDETPELFFRDGEEPPPQPQQEEDEWSSVVPSGLLAALGGAPDYTPHDQSDGVAELLISQTETADLVLLNKVDLVSNDEETTNQIQDIVQAINPRAKVVRTEFGAIDLQNVLGMAQGRGVVEAGIVDDHKESIAATLAAQQSAISSNGNDDPEHSHSHSHSHSHDSDKANGADSSSPHSHAHDHHHHSNGDDPDVDGTTTDSSSSSHAHSHDHGPSSSRSHEHSHDHDVCTDPDCTDHSHEHSHAHGDDATSTTTHAGIGTFVYRARRPFHPGRLASFLRLLPIARGLPEEEGKEEESLLTSSTEARNMLQRIIRSKGFTWCANSHAAALYWSQSGPNFELKVLGSWWATLDRSQWPPEAVDSILEDFDNANHSAEDERTCASSVGDRRQEIVFIGPTLGLAMNQDLIQTTLDQCLLNDAEWNDYIEKLQSSPAELASRFPSPFDSRVMSF